MADDGSTSVPADGMDAFWTFGAVEERMVEAMLLWWRTPGGGKWPFASDAPWHLMTKLTRAGSTADVQLNDAFDPPSGDEARLPLTRAEIARRDGASEWLSFVPERDRKLVVLALLSLAKGAKRVPWMRIKRLIGVEFGADGLRMRYSRAITAIAAALNSRISAKGECQEG